MPAASYVTTLAQWTRDTLIAGTFHDLVFINTQDGHFKRLSPLHRDVSITRLLVDAQHRLWVGTWGEGCLVGIPFRTGFSRLKWERDQPSNVDNIVTGIAESSTPNSHNIWISGYDVIGKYPLDIQTRVFDTSRLLIQRPDHHSDMEDPGTIWWI